MNKLQNSYSNLATAANVGNTSLNRTHILAEGSIRCEEKRTIMGNTWVKNCTKCGHEIFSV